MSIGSMLSVARSAIMAHQAAMEVTGHNIANSQTEGYSRQELLLAPSTPLRNTIGNFGTGVSMVTVQRTRDALLDGDVRTQSAPAAGSGLRRDLLTRVEGVFNEPSDTGIGSALDSFWNAWSDLASNPANPGAKSVVRQAALSLTDRLNTAANQLGVIANDTRDRIISDLDQANRLSTQIANLNAQIVPAEAGGNTANDLRDQRDLLIDQLSEILPVTVIDRPDGSDQVMLGGRPVVDGTVAKTLVLNPGKPLTVSFAGESSPARISGGRLGAAIDVANNDIAGALASLDQIASSLVTDVNALHVTGWSPPSGAAGNWNPATPPTGSGVPFFDTAPGNATAGNIRLSVQVNADANAIAVGDALDMPGNNAIALAVSGLRDFSPSAAGNSFGGAYRNTIAVIAASARAATDTATVASTVADQAKARRDATTGVSTDEELMRLMRHQQAYAAAAKLVQAIDEMSRVLIDLKQ